MMNQYKETMKRGIARILHRQIKPEIRPKRLVFALVTMLIMLTLTVFAWDGITKRLLICILLTMLSTVLLLLPELPNGISIPLLAFYLYYVPSKIFQRMELPIHDMSEIGDGVLLLTTTFIICVYLLVFLFTQHSGVALAAGSGFFLILFLVEYYIGQFRGDFLMPYDLGAIGTAASIMSHYDYKLSPEALYSVIYFLFFIVLGSRIRVRMHKWIHVGISLLAVLSVATWYYAIMNTENPFGKELIIDYWNIQHTREINGACLSFFLLWKDSKIDVPKDYSEEALLIIAENAEAEYRSLNVRESENTSETENAPESGAVAKTKPNIIMIMNEAWSDLRVLGSLNTTEAFMPYFDSLQENTVKGKLYVSILGGLTANTEFEALTGNSLSLLAPAVIPYQNQVNHDMPSLARILKAQGYETMAMHPGGEDAWNRKQVYAYLDFDQFIHQGLWNVPYEYIRDFISDTCNYKEIINRFENRNPEAPFFLFDVTIQNHGSYYEQVPLHIDVTNVGGVPAEKVGYLKDARTYLNLLKISDDALSELLSYFENVEDPTIICIFGDHQPLLSDYFYEAVFAQDTGSPEEQNLRKYVVPYCIWANYDVDWKVYGDMSANYLPAALMECAGLEMPPFYQYLMNLYNEYPVLTKRGCLDSDGNLIDIADIWDTDRIRQYRMLQYSQLYEKKSPEELFEKTRQ